MKTLNLNDTNLYKRNMSIHNNLFKVYFGAIVFAGIVLLINGLF